MGIFIDSHCDTPSRLVKGADFFVREDGGQYDYDSMVKGGVDCAFMALYTPNDCEPAEALVRVMKMLAAVNDTISCSEGRLRLAVSVQDIVDNARDGVRSVALGLENAAPLGESLPLLRQFYRMGVRYVTLTHNGNNQVCDAASAKDRLWGGLSPFGRDFVREMNDLGMMVDISHLSDNTVRDILDISRVPVIASHSCCRALAGHPRNLNDELIRKVAAAGGVIQVNFYPLFLSGGDSAPYTAIADHIDHIVRLVGIDYVGIGSDYDGIDTVPDGMEDVSCMGMLINELVRRGYGPGDIDLIKGGNFLRVFKAVEEGRRKFPF